MKQFTLTFVLCIATIVYGQNQLLSSVDQFFDSSTNTFVNSGANDYSYDINGNLTESFSYTWDSGNGQWIISAKEVYTYNAQNKVTSILYEEYDQSTGLYSISEREVLTYNVSGNVIELLVEDYNVNNQFVNEFRAVFSYNGSFLSVGLLENWGGSSWIPEERISYNYNNNQQLSDFEYEEFINGSYQLDEREVITYNTNGQIIGSSYESWNGSSYDVEEISTFNYDNNGNGTDQVVSFNTIPVPDFREKINFDTSVSINTIDHPFKDKTGLDYLGFPFPYVNIPLNQEYQNYDSNNMSYDPTSFFTTYNYQSRILSNEEELDLFEVDIFPNPAKSFINVSTVDASQNLKIEIFDFLGNSVMNTSKRKIDLKSLSSGLYIIKVMDEKGNSTIKKIVKQ